MTILQAIIIGLVHGIGEIFPVSGSGHLSLLGNLFGMSAYSDGNEFFLFLLRLAAFLSLCFVWGDELRRIFTGILYGYTGDGRQPSEEGRIRSIRYALMLALGTLPLFFILPLQRQILRLFSQNTYVGIAFILTGCVLYVADHMHPERKTEKSITILDALIIGICQCVSCIPGLSRTAVVITGGRACGLNKDFSVRYAMLLGIPAFFGASILALIQAIDAGINWHYVPAYLVGTVVALIAGTVAGLLFKKWCKTARFGTYGYYDWVVGALYIILTAIF